MLLLRLIISKHVCYPRLVVSFGYFQTRLLFAACFVAAFGYFQTGLLSTAYLVAAFGYLKKFVIHCLSCGCV